MHQGQSSMDDEAQKLNASEHVDNDAGDKELVRTRAPKHKRVPPGFNHKTTIKKGLLRFLRWVEPVENRIEEKGKQFLAILEELTLSISIWAFYASILHQMHFIRMFGLNSKLALKWTATKVDHAFALVSDGPQLKSNVKESSPDLYHTHQQYFVPIFGGISTPRKRAFAMRSMCEQARTLYHTALSNHILTTFSSRLKTWFKLKILAWFAANKLDFPSKKSLYPITTGLSLRILTNSKNEKYLPTDEQLENTGLPDEMMSLFRIELDTTVALARSYLENKPITDGELKERWWAFMPWLYKILQDTEDWLAFCKTELESKHWTQQQHNKATRRVKLFHLCPQHKVGMQHVHITNRSLLNMGREMKLWDGEVTEKHLQEDPDKYWNMFFRIREMTKPNQTNILPEYSVSTDGVSVSVMFAKKGNKRLNKKEESKQAAAERKVELLNDPTASAVKFQHIDIYSNTPKVGVDPGMRKLFHAVRLLNDTIKPWEEQLVGQQPERKEVSLSAHEYRHKAGEPARRYRAHGWAQELETKLAKLLKQAEEKPESKGEEESIQQPNSPFDKIHHVIIESKDELKKNGKKRKRKSASPSGQGQEKAENLKKRHVHPKIGTNKKTDRWSIIQDRKIKKNGRRTARKTAKVSSFTILQERLKVRARELDIEWAHKSKKRERRLKLDSYIGHQKADTFACKKLLDGLRPEKIEGKKHVKILIAFGNARFMGVKGLPRGPVKRIFEKLRKEYKRHCFVSPTCEAYTSQKCPRCGGQTLRVKKSLKSSQLALTPAARVRPSRARWKIPREEREEEEEVDDDEDTSIVYGLKACQKCSIVYDRDSMGAENILKAWNSLNETGKRPSYLCAPPGQKKGSQSKKKKKKEVFYQLKPSLAVETKNTHCAQALEFNSGARV